MIWNVLHSCIVWCFEANMADWRGCSWLNVISFSAAPHTLAQGPNVKLTNESQLLSAEKRRCRQSMRFQS